MAVTTIPVNIEKLIEIMEYLTKYQHRGIPVLSYNDDKKMSKAEKEKFSTRPDHVIDPNNLKDEVQSYLEWCTKERRSFCFYMNGAMQRNEIERIRFHFVDIDEKDGGTKEEQYERIKNAPIQPTLIYRGRAGYKLLYEVKEAIWDSSTHEKEQESADYFEGIQEQLIDYFKGDTSKAYPHACFRLPFTNNYKEYTEKGMVYQEEIIFFEPSNIYTQEQLSMAFPRVERKIKNHNSISYSEYGKEVKEIVECFKDYLDQEGLIYTEYEGKISYQCPIHDDSTASAYMFYNNLICHCSNGDANLDCEIAKGKQLSWIAAYKGWTDLEEKCKELESKPSEKYERISLDDMRSNELVPLQEKADIVKGHVKGILAEVIKIMTSRQIVVDETTINVLTNIIHELTIQEEGVTVCSLEPGGGKSTVMVAFLKYMLENVLSEAGAIIVVERINTAKKLAELLGDCILFVDADGKAIDVPYYKHSPAAFVMESAFTYKKCKQKLEKYEYGVCRACPFKAGCTVYKKHQEQKNYPIVIMTHVRLQMEADGLNKYKKWRCKDGNEYERKHIIIDEKPPIVDIVAVKDTKFAQFLLDVRSMELDIGVEAVTETIMLVKKLREQIIDAKNGQLISSIDADWTFPYSKTWYKKYTGEDVNLLKDIEYTIQNGGRVNRNQEGNISIVTNRTIQYDFSGYLVVILDGTAKIDMEYRALQSHKMLDIPRIKSYKHLKFFVDFTQSSSKSKLKQNKGILVDGARNISIISTKERVLVLCFKDHVSIFESLLDREIREGRVLINHYGNVKGSNNYSHCTALVLVGTIHKGDPYYINKHEAICGEVIDTLTTTVKNVRRFKDFSIETIKLNDQVIDTIQDILRISIRNNGASVQAKVYMLTRDVALINLLKNYFVGCETEYWNMSGTYPEWYEKLDEYFSILKSGAVIKKATLREVLQLEGEAGKKQFRRYINSKLFAKLQINHGIGIVNNRTYKKVDIAEVERHQAVL